MFKKLFLGIMLASMVLMTGCEIVTLDPDNPNRGPDVVDGGTSTNDIDRAYSLRKGDPIYIRFSGIVDQQQLEVVIDENGEISLLHLEPIQAAGLTTSQLEYTIERAYIDAKIYVNVSVNVTMTAMVYYVQGEVNAPGKYQLVSGTTLLQAIADARGPTSFADLKKVTISRQHGKQHTHNVKNYQKNPSLDVKIEAGDLINVPEKWY